VGGVGGVVVWVGGGGVWGVCGGGGGVGGGGGGGGGGVQAGRCGLSGILLCTYASITLSEGPTPQCKRVATTILPQVSETVIGKPTNMEVLLYNSINTSISKQLILINILDY